MSERKSSSLAFASPARRARGKVMPKSPPKPTFENAVVSFACSEAIRRSHARANPSPAPAAGPLMAAIVTFGREWRSRGRRCASRWRSTRCSRVSSGRFESAILPTSPPAQKPRPAPVKSTTATAGSVVQRSSVAIASRIISSESAFSFSGRFSVRRAIPSAMSTWRCDSGPAIGRGYQAWATFTGPFGPLSPMRSPSDQMRGPDEEHDGAQVKSTR